MYASFLQDFLTEWPAQREFFLVYGSSLEDFLPEWPAQRDFFFQVYASFLQDFLSEWPAQREMFSGVCLFPPGFPTPMARAAGNCFSCMPPS